MSRKTKRDVHAQRAADDKRRAKLGLTGKKPEPELDMTSTIFSKHGLLLPPFSRHGLTIVRRSR